MKHRTRKLRSIRKADMCAAIHSVDCMRVNILATTPMVAAAAGTKLPIWARYTIRPKRAAPAEQPEQAQALLVGALHALLEVTRVSERAEHLQAAVAVLVHGHHVTTEQRLNISV